MTTTAFGERRKKLKTADFLRALTPCAHFSQFNNKVHVVVLGSNWQPPKRAKKEKKPIATLHTSLAFRSST